MRAFSGNDVSHKAMISATHVSLAGRKIKKKDQVHNEDENLGRL